MITVNSMLGENSGTAEMELKGLSTDIKPTGSFSGKKLGENSLFIELDTGDIYYYHGGEWSIMSTGGGGGGSGEEYVVVFTHNDGTIVPRHDGESISVADIIAAKEAGKNVYGKLDSGVLLDLRFVNDIGQAVLFAGTYYDGSNQQDVTTQYFCISGTWLDFSWTMPHPSAADNGKVLGVAGDVYALVPSCAPYIVHLEVHLDAGTATVTDGKTIADILAVADSNPNVFVEFPLGLNNKGRLPLVNWDSTAGDTNVYFAGVTAGAKGVGINGTNDGTGDIFTIVLET